MKKFILMILFFCLVLSFSGCIPTLQNVSLDFESSSINLEEGENYQLLPVVAGIADFQIIYSEYDDTILTVSATGEIHAIKEGLTSVKATLSGYDISTNVIVNVGPTTTDIDDEKVYAIFVVGGIRNYEIGETVQLTLRSGTENYTETINWISSKPSVATVSSDGLVSAIAGGTANISALYDGKIASVSITVNTSSNENPVLEVTALTISGTYIVDVGATTTLTATPNADIAYSVNWSSSNTSIATISSSGVVSGVASGIVTITVTLATNSSVTTSCTILVRDSSVSTSVTGITLSGTNEVLAGSRIKLSHAFTPSGSTGTVLYTSSNNALATVDQAGWVTGITGGSVQITVTLTENTSISDTLTITVIGLPTSISITGNNNITVGASSQLLATVLPSGVSQAVSWSSSNTAIATVSSSGLVNGVAAGSATITVTSIASSQITATYNITVVNAPTISISNTTTSIVVGQTKTLTATLSNISNTAVTWSSSNTAIATVSSSGVVTAVAAGNATITVTSVANSSLTATCTVTVTAATPTKSITLAIGKNALVVDDQTQITPTVTGTTNFAVTYSTSNTLVALVSSSGVVTAKGIGNATITVTLVADTSVKATVNLTVSANTYPAPGTKTGVLDLKILIGSSPSIILGQSIELTITGATSRYNYTWTSSNSSVATVSAIGKVVGASVGYATITAVLIADTTQTGTFSVRVYEDLSAEISILYSGGAVISVGATTQLSISSSTGDTNVTWVSNNNSIATVSSTGLVTAVSAGTAIITANLVSNPTVQATAYIIVGSGEVTEHTAVFNWLEQYLVSSTLSRNVLTYGTTTKTEIVLGSVSYFWPGAHTVNNEFYGRVDGTMSSVWYVTIHHTGNNNLGAAARNTASYMSTSTGVSIHYATDQSSVYAINKETSVAWHAGDGSRVAGSTYFNETYQVTCITGGNMNSIGIEMCQNEGNDLYMTWHRTAKLVADILKRHSLNTTRVKQHNDFMGKNCPQELRESGLWTDVFAKMVKAEYQYKSLYSDYTIAFSSSNPAIIDNYGHVISRPTVDTIVNYTVTISKAGITESKTYAVTVPCNIESAITGRADKTVIS